MRSVDVSVGGGLYYSTGKIVINGGFVTAKGGQDAPGLGSGCKLAQGRGFVVKITGGR